jgi:hypothetical protein
MAKVNPYKFGDKVLASRAQDGTGHEEAVVVDVYSLLIAGDERPMVVVEFPDEKRAWLNAESEDVMPADDDGDGAGNGAQARKTSTGSI